LRVAAAAATVASLNCVCDVVCHREQLSGKVLLHVPKKRSMLSIRRAMLSIRRAM
jgi:hypothetical protein